MPDKKAHQPPSIETLQRSLIELSVANEALIDGFVRAQELREREIPGHTQRVADLTIRLAQACGVNEADLADIRHGALLHDIGKWGVPDWILLKPQTLTDEEWVLMKQHPQNAYDLLSPVIFLHKALDIPLYHHEKWDGSGYPRGLQGKNIPQAARIFAVVDVWDALTSHRPYREAWPRNTALAEITSLSGTHFDPETVELFLKMMKADPA